MAPNTQNQKSNLIPDQNLNFIKVIRRFTTFKRKIFTYNSEVVQARNLEQNIMMNK